MHEHGQAVGQSVAEAVRLYRLASAQGYQSARLRLGEMLVKGDAEGLPADPAAGTRLIAWAARQSIFQLIGQQARGLLRELIGVAAVARACCVGCGKTRGLAVCGRCWTAKFCGRECQRRVWRAHRQGCSLWAAEGGL